jgi:hypothetical protein
MAFPAICWFNFGAKQKMQNKNYLIFLKFPKLSKNQLTLLQLALGTGYS